MYTIAIKDDFSAYHFLVGGNRGTENQLHSHQYQIEVSLEGTNLNEHGFLVDIADIKTKLDRITAYFQDKTLNDIPQFRGINPSIEHLARVIHRMLFIQNPFPGISDAAVKIWEDEEAWTLYRERP